MRAVLTASLLLMCPLNCPVLHAAEKPIQDGRGARPHVVSWYKQHSLSTGIRVVGQSRSASQKSLRVAVETKSGHQVRLLNVHRNDPHYATKTPTGLTKQSTARGLANLKLRRERSPAAGAFSGVVDKGLSIGGRQYVFGSKTDPNEFVRVGVGNSRMTRAFRFDNRKAPKAFSNPVD